MLCHLWHDIINSMAMNLNKPQEMVKDREARRAAVHGVAKSQTQLSDRTTACHLLPFLFSSQSECPSKWVSYVYIYIHTHIYDKCSVVICWLVFVVAVMFFLLWWEIWLRKHIVWIHRKKCNQNKQEHLRNSGSYLDSNIGVIFKRKIFKLKIISVLVKPLGSISWVHCCLQKHCSKHIYQKYDKIV